MVVCGETDLSSCSIPPTRAFDLIVSASIAIILPTVYLAHRCAEHIKCGHRRGAKYDKAIYHHIQHSLMSLYPPPASTSIKDIPTVDLDNPPPPVEVLKMGVWTAYRARPGMSQLLFFIINILSGRGSAECSIPRVVSLIKVILNYVQGWCHYKIRSSRAVGCIIYATTKITILTIASTSSF